MPERTRAELLADGGEAAASDDLFRSRAFLAAERVTHTLRIAGEDRTTLVPLVVRRIPGSELCDAISPYGYPGARVEGDGPAPDPSRLDWSSTGLVSVFVRDRLGAATLAGATERSLVQVHDPARPRRIRGRLAEQVRAAERDGWRVDAVPGPDATPGLREEFVLAYEQTMRRTEADERYFFGAAVYEAALSFPASWLLVARGPGGEAGAAALAATSDSHLHYFLGGTADASLDASPFKNVVVAMLDLADRVELPLNLGGGITPGDGLERFKRGFANGEATFLTHEIVSDRDAYEELAAGRSAGAYFPAYRAL